MTRYQEFTLAAVQAAPIPFDREASTEKACRLIEEAAAQGATLAAFGETWLPGYPFFAFTSPGPLWWKAAAEYLANAVEIPSPTTERLCAAARRAGIDVVIGVVELDPRTRGTVYCTLLFIGRDGALLGRHRKLKPTHAERAIWGEGDALGLRTYDRPYGRLSGLNCWEHNMVLPGYALMAQGTQVHVAAWPGREPSVVPPAPVSVWPRQLLLSRAFASQAAAYVVMVGGLRLPDDTPERYRELATFHHTGDSAIIDPRGEVIAGQPAQIKSPIANNWSSGDLATLVNTIKPGTVDRPRTIAVQQCSYSQIIQASDWLPAEIGTVAYFSYDNPGQSPRIPIYAGTLSLPDSFKIDCQKSYREDAACWRIRRTNRLSQIKWGWARQYLEPAVMEFEKQLFMEQPLIERKALELMTASDGDDDMEFRKFLTRYTNNWAGATMQRWWELGDFFWAYYARGW